MSKKAHYKEQKRKVMAAFNANYPLHNRISEAYDKATGRQQMLMFLCASMPAEKVETAMHVLGNLIKGNDIVQVNDDIYNELDNLVKDNLRQEVGDLWMRIMKERKHNTSNELQEFFLEGVFFELSNDKTVCFETRGDEIVAYTMINPSKKIVIETFSTIF